MLARRFLTAPVQLMHDAAGLALATDGATAAVTRYGLWSGWRHLLDSMGSSHRFRSRLREAEESDPEGKRGPRSKMHDDLALIAPRQVQP